MNGAPAKHAGSADDTRRRKLRAVTLLSWIDMLLRGYSRSAHAVW